MSSHHHHRPSFSSDLRGPPPSPRQQRHTSLSSNALQELLNNPPLPHRANDAFAGRDWKTIQVGEIIDPSQAHWAEEGTSVENATSLLVEVGSPNVILVRKSKDTTQFVDTFDYSDLNAYLLLAVGINKPPEGPLGEIPAKARAGEKIPLKDIAGITSKEDHVTLPHTAPLTKAVEIFGSGVHRIIVLKEGTRDTISVLTQLRLVRFFWEEGRHFAAVEKVFPVTLKDLGVGQRSVVSINGDKPVAEALTLMSRESITSLPVLDNHHNVVGNISHVDVRLLTTSASLPLLSSSCIHFISVILSQRGMNDGKDSFPVFHVSPFSTLAHTVAKLVATISHRMWVVDAPSPSSSTPQTPTSLVTTFHAASLSAPLVPGGPPYTSSTSGVPAASLPGQHMSGRLSGVVSLTDVLNIIARASGLHPHNPDEARRRRRRSSSSSVRASIDSARSSSIDLTRVGTASGSKR